MNILFINSASRGFGGNEKSILLAAKSLVPEHKAIVACRKTEIAKHTNLQTYILPFLFEGDLYTIAKLVAIVRKHNIDVIIPSKRKDYALAGIVSRLCGIQNILWLGALRTPENTISNRLIYHHLADGIMVNAKQIKKGLLACGWLEEKNIRVIYNGLNTLELDAFAHGNKCTPPPLLITAMGRLDKNKSFDFLLKSFARFLTNNPEANAKLTIIGEGSERPLLEQLIRQLNLTNNAFLHGFTDNPYPLLETSHVFTMSSISEGLSIALLEAMYLNNAPVTTYAGGGVQEIIYEGKNGFLVEHGDEQHYADILTLLYNNPDLRCRIAAAAHESVAERYAPAKIKQEITTFCQQTIQRKKS